jgi:hypothetical protein
MVLDENDIESLKQVIDRAEKKAQSLKSLCGSKDLSVITRPLSA